MNRNKPATLGDLSDLASELDRKWAIRFLRLEARMDERFEQVSAQMRDFTRQMREQHLDIVALVEGLAVKVNHLDCLVKGSS